MTYEDAISISKITGMTKLVVSPEEFALLVKKMENTRQADIVLSAEIGKRTVRFSYEQDDTIATRFVESAIK